jgi:hypothetical protein
VREVDSTVIRITDPSKIWYRFQEHLVETSNQGGSRR